MKTSKNLFTLIELLVVGACITIVLVAVIVISAVLIGGCIIAKKVKDEGAKPTIERVWEGPEKPEKTEPTQAPEKQNE